MNNAKHYGQTDRDRETTAARSAQRSFDQRPDDTLGTATGRPLPGLPHAIESSLMRPPATPIPPGFAARVARLAVQAPLPPPSRWFGWGPRVALGSAGLLTVAMFVVAPHTVPSLLNARFDAELVLLTELSGLLLFAHRLLPRG